MTKRSEKHFQQWRKENAGCLRGLINVFYFRQGRSTHRLLSNRRQGNANNLGITKARNKVDLPCKLEENNVDMQSIISLSDTESDEAVMVKTSVSSISTLMEKEMSSTYHSRKEFRSTTKWIKAELGTGATSDKNVNEATKSAALRDKNLNASSNSISQRSDHPDMSTILSSELDLSTFMLDYCSRFLECEKSPFEHKNKTGKPLKPHQNQQPGTKVFQKQSDHYFFRKREKLTAVYQSNECDDAEGLDRIVVLKPTHVRNQNLSNAIAPLGSISYQNKQDQERFSSHFSLKEIRKRFRNVIGASRKEKHPIAMDGILHKIPYGKEMTTGTENGGEKRLDDGAYEKKNVFSAPSEITARKKLSKKSAPRALYTEGSFCDEARKHLADFLRTGSENESVSPIHVSKSLGRLLSFPGFNYLSPRLSPAREKDKVLKENRSLLLCRSKENNDSEHSELFGQGEGFLNTDQNPKLKNEIVEIIEIEEVSPPEAQSVLISNEDDLSCEAFMEEGSSMLQEPEQSEARFEPLSPSTPIASKLPIVQESKETECAMENADRPSPISVLEPLFFDDLNIPKSMLSWRLKATDADTQTQPEESQIDNSAAASGSTDAEADFISFAEFNEPLLFDELEVRYSMRIDDPKLLFDCIDEVLAEIKERHFSFTSRVSFINPTILLAHKHEYFMKEACGRIDRHLDMQFPNTLEQIVKKDLDGTVWIDLQFGAEITVTEIGDYILEYLFEEIAVEL